MLKGTVAQIICHVAPRLFWCALLVACGPVSWSQKAPEPVPVTAGAGTQPKAPSPLKTTAPAPSLSPVATSAFARYSNPALGFAVDYPSKWQIEVQPELETGDVLGRFCPGTIGFATHERPYDDQAFGMFGIHVRVCMSPGTGTIRETVEAELQPMAPSYRNRIKLQCCLVVAGEPAVTLTGLPDRWDRREIRLLHDDLEYAISLYPAIGLDRLPGSRVDAAFSAFVRSFRFMPMTQGLITPTVPPPVPTP